MSDFADLKKLAQEANKEFPAKEDIWSMVCTPTVGLELIAEIERLQGFEAAYKEFSDKTDWVQETAHWSELGMHRADVLRKRADELKAENEVLVSALNDILRVTPMGVEAFGIAALVIGELGVSKESSHG
jgi:hypothetical protein